MNIHQRGEKHQQTFKSPMRYATRKSAALTARQRAAEDSFTVRPAFKRSTGSLLTDILQDLTRKNSIYGGDGVSSERVRMP
jgi:hypothetical protein